MSSYRSPLIASFAGQLHRSPRRLRLRHLLGIEFLLSVLDTEKSYPFDFVCHAVTGFRPRDASEHLIDGGMLREDAIVLAEQISADAELTAQTWPEPVFAVPDLARRFDVSTKTIFRWHRRGLVGWRFRFPDGRMRLAFPERCVRRFVGQNADLVARGSSFSQLTQAERERVLMRARELVQAGERTVNAVARSVAAETGRAVETIRLLLRQYDEAHPKAGLFNRSTLQVDPDDQRLPVWEAYLDGATIAALAARFARSEAWVYRTITQMRARELRTRKLEFVASAEFDGADADRLILADPVLRHPHADAAGPVRVPADLPPYLRQLFSIPLLSPRGEYALFRKMNYLKFKADRLRQAVDPEAVAAADLDEIEELLSEAGRVKNQITQANLRLVVSIAKRHLAPGRDFFEIVSDGNVSLMRAVDKFDYARGFKFSTYASWAIIKNFARSVPEQRHHHDRYQTGREELIESVAGPELGEHEEDFLSALRSTLDRMLATLDEREQSILRKRFGLDRGDGPLTLDQVGQRFGVSKERVRQLEVRAMARLRSDFHEDVRKLLGA
jgi:RNA polymerase primary sigma factor